MLETAEIGHAIDKQTYDETVPALREALIEDQIDLVRSAGFQTVVLLSGVKTAGKGETINQLSAWMDPRYIEINAPDMPTDEDRQRPYMWRFWRLLPPKGRIGIFFTHWYSEPLLRRIMEPGSDADFAKRLAEIDRFERMLADEGALILKFYLQISKEKQRRRMKKLASDPATSWRVTEEDWLALEHYDAIGPAAEEMIRLTSRGHAPWVVVEAADRRYRNLAVAQALHTALRHRLDAPDPSAPASPAAQSPVAAEARLDDRTVLSSLDYGKSLDPQTYKADLEALQGRLAGLTRDKRFRKRSLIAVFEGTDAAGKGGAIRRAASAIDTRFRRIVPIAKPTDEEAAQPYLWRFWRQLPRRGHTTIFDRSWYGRVLVERVEGFCSEADWRRAYGEINDFESDLVTEGVVLVKFWLAITKDEQLRRFRERETQAFKRFKITDEDRRNRERWDDYVAAVEDMVERTSTDLAPWTLVEAESKLYARIKVLRTLCERLDAAL